MTGDPAALTFEWVGWGESHWAASDRYRRDPDGWRMVRGQWAHAPEAGGA